MKGLQWMSKAYLEPKRASVIKFLCENSLRLKVVNYFGKKTALEMFNWVLNKALKIMKSFWRSLDGETRSVSCET